IVGNPDRMRKDAVLRTVTLVGVHGELAGFPAVDRSAQVAYAFFCWFDDRGRCTSAEVFLDWGALVLPSGQ
ncbi:MAG: hypothetical protein OXU20_35675, partial [Myxococcales bacterium]|nr:hypothetical protein [Myxococcales bacterium]